MAGDEAPCLAELDPRIAEPRSLRIERRGLVERADSRLRPPAGLSTSSGPADSLTLAGSPFAAWMRTCRASGATLWTSRGVLRPRMATAGWREYQDEPYGRL